MPSGLKDIDGDVEGEKYVVVREASW